jgi:hypothetical protein
MSRPHKPALKHSFDEIVTAVADGAGVSQRPLGERFYPKEEILSYLREGGFIGGSPSSRTIKNFTKPNSKLDNS